MWSWWWCGWGEVVFHLSQRWENIIDYLVTSHVMYLPYVSNKIVIAKNANSVLMRNIALGY